MRHQVVTPKGGGGGGEARHAQVEMAGRLGWVRSSFFREEDGTPGTTCIHATDSTQDVREHPSRGPSRPRRW